MKLIIILFFALVLINCSLQQKNKSPKTRTPNSVFIPEEHFTSMCEIDPEPYEWRLAGPEEQIVEDPKLSNMTGPKQVSFQLMKKVNLNNNRFQNDIAPIYFSLLDNRSNVTDFSIKKPQDDLELPPNLSVSFPNKNTLLVRFQKYDINFDFIKNPSSPISLSRATVTMWHDTPAVSGKWWKFNLDSKPSESRKYKSLHKAQCEISADSSTKIIYKHQRNSHSFNGVYKVIFGDVITRGMSLINYRNRTCTIQLSENADGSIRVSLLPKNNGRCEIDNHHIFSGVYKKLTAGKSLLPGIMSDGLDKEDSGKVFRNNEIFEDYKAIRNIYVNTDVYSKYWSGEGIIDFEDHISSIYNKTTDNKIIIEVYHKGNYSPVLLYRRSDLFGYQ